MTLHDLEREENVRTLTVLMALAVLTCISSLVFFLIIGIPRPPKPVGRIQYKGVEYSLTCRIDADGYAELRLYRCEYPGQGACLEHVASDWWLSDVCDEITLQVKDGIIEAVVGPGSEHAALTFQP